MHPIASIQFKTNHSDGVVSFIKSQSGTDDIIAKKIVSISYSSSEPPSKDPCVMFGINSSSESDYFSTKHTLTEPKFISYLILTFTVLLLKASVFGQRMLIGITIIILKHHMTISKQIQKELFTFQGYRILVRFGFIFQLKKQNHLVFLISLLRANLFSQRRTLQYITLNSLVMYISHPEILSVVFVHV